MSSTFDRVVLGLAAIVLAPALVVGAGFYVAAGLAFLVLVGGYGGRYGAQLVKNQHIGARARNQSNDMRDIVGGSNGDDDSDWRKQ